MFISTGWLPLRHPVEQAHVCFEFRRIVLSEISLAGILRPFDFTTVDVAETLDGPVVFEVSAFGGFRGAKEGIGLDAAARYTDYVLEQLT